MIKAVIFDMDGVIIDSEPLYLGWYRKFLEENNIFVEEKEFNKIAGAYAKVEEQLLAKWWNEAKADCKTGEEVYRLFDKFYEKYVKEHPYSFHDIKDKNIYEVMYLLKQNGFKIAIASSTPIDIIRQVIEEINIAKFVDVIVSGEMFKESKPNPEIYNFTMAQLNLTPKECIAIEDSTYGIQAAKNAGIATLAKKDDRFHFNQKIADEVIDDLMQIFEILKI